jgi:hypothetical protein
LHQNLVFCNSVSLDLAGLEYVGSIPSKYGPEYRRIDDLLHP